jgi:protein phosphatase
VTAEGGGSQDNCTALVLRVDALPAERLRDNVARLRQLPLPPRLKPGQQLDGLTVDALLHESVVTLLYRVHDARGQACVLKTLRPEHDDPQAAAALAHEEWLARRVSDAWFPQVIPHPPRSHLYYLMSWHDGATLKARLDNGHRFGSGEVAELGARILKGLAALHRLSIVHRDIKPDNLHVDAEGRLRILDLGVAAADSQHDGQAFEEINNPGTPSYMAPSCTPPGRCRPASRPISTRWASPSTSCSPANTPTARSNPSRPRSSATRCPPPATAPTSRLARIGAAEGRRP